MTSDDDPEARIRALEQPLADTARASEVGSTPPPGKWSAPPPPGKWSPPPPPPTYTGPTGPAYPPPPPPLPYSSSFSSTSSGLFSRSRTWWIVAAVVVVGTIALPAGILLFTANQFSRSGVSTLFPTPSVAPTYSAPSGGVTQTPAIAPPSTSAAAVPTAPAGERLSISGISESHTIACNNNAVSVSGVSNKVVITGHCASLDVSGVQNVVTVDAVDSIQASGFNNHITYHSGSPNIDQAGDGNVIGQG